MADVEKTEKGLADAKNVITSKDCEVSTLKEQVQCVLAHLCLFVAHVCECGVLSVCVCGWLVCLCVSV